MLAKKCDICKNYFDYDGDLANAIVFAHKELKKDAKRVVMSEMDACPTCMRAIDMLIRNLMHLDEGSGDQNEDNKQPTEPNLESDGVSGEPETTG